MKDGDSMLNEIDLHGCSSKDAKLLLDQYLNRLPKSIHQVCVIHGYHGGTALRSFIRKQYHHPRVERSMLSMNQGETILILK